MRLYKIIGFVGLFIPLSLMGQTEQLVVNLTNPKQPGELYFQNLKGSVTVAGFDGEAIIVEATPRIIDDEYSNKDGLKKIPTNNFKLTAQEDNNIVSIKCNSYEKTIDFNIKVPYNFSLKIKIVDNGKIVVNGVKGTIEVSNINGNINLDGISGSVVANTIDGDIKVAFKEVDKESPMAFSSVDGNIEVVFPSNISAVFKMKSQEGEVFSNFDMQFEQRKPTIKKRNNTSVITLDDWTIGKVNSGGPEYLFSTIDGNIYITKR